ncbi:MAG: hypothetical protein V1779_08565 [bacterium]
MTKGRKDRRQNNGRTERRKKNFREKVKRKPMSEPQIKLIHLIKMISPLL